MIDAGAEVNAINNNGKGVLDVVLDSYISFSKKQPGIELLEKHSATPNYYAITRL